MVKLLVANPLLLLFLVAAVGYPLGRIKIRGSSLGVASVLFAGLAIGSLHPELKLPEIIYVLGLALFVYAVGLSSGPAFVASLREEGIRNNILAVGTLTFAALLTFGAHLALKLKPTLTAGLFAGSLTNTPALAGALESIKAHAPKELLDQMLGEPVVGYSIAYPMGVIGTILTISLMQRIWKVDYQKEARSMKKLGASAEQIMNRTLRVTNPLATKMVIEDLLDEYNWEIIFGRIRHENTLSLAGPHTSLSLGDLVVVVGTEEEIDKVERFIGERSEEKLDVDRSEYYFRRIFVSDSKVIGRRLSDLKLLKQFGAVVTRIKRGDMDMIPRDSMILEPGDRVRVVAHRERMQEVSAFFGDSYRDVSEADILTFSLGLTLGLLLGIIPIPLPGGLDFKLGFAGGPLIAGLILGTVERTGSFVWGLPYSVNLTLRQIGLVFFLAGVGTRAGYSFFSTLTHGGGLAVFIAGIIITCSTTLLTLWIGHRLIKIPFSILIGMLAGLQTQSAVLGYALEQSGNDLPNVGFTSVYPVATITKILFVQVLLSLLL